MRNENDTNQAGDKPIVSPPHTAEQNRKMKINIKSKNATKAPISATQAGKTAKRQTTVAQPKLPSALKWLPAIALVSGARGMVARAVLTATDKSGKVWLKATQNEIGLPLKDACGDRVGRVQMGGYANGRNIGAKVTITNLATFIKKSAPCNVCWSADDNRATVGRYIGKVSEKGIIATLVYFGKVAFPWQCEQDSNANNRHERGRIQPATAGAKLTDISW
jgi:hypothetical protein